MSNPASNKSKPPPWIPPGKGIPQYIKRAKPVTIIKRKKDDPVIAEVPPQWESVNVPGKEDNRDVDADMMSLSSHSSNDLDVLNQENEFGIHHVSLLQEIKLLYVHFASLKTSYLSAHRLIGFRDIEDSHVNELFIEAGSYVKTLNALFDDLEYSMSVLENTLNENQKKVEFSTVLRNKEKLLSTLLGMYEKIIFIFLLVFEKQDFKEALRVQESLSEKLKTVERKCATQGAVITDLERRLSIYQSKAGGLENYKTNLESAKVELEKKLLHKETQIKYLSDELMKSSEKYSKSDREDFIEIIEDIKSKSHTEKSALKKALKFLKAQSEKKEVTYKKLLQEANEKEKMMFDLAAQRDQLKVQLTVVNNNIIQLKHQMEEMKLQNLKLQSEMSEKDLSHKKEMIKLRSNIEEKSLELGESLNRIKRFQETVAELENKLKKSKEQSSEAFKNKVDVPNQVDLHASQEMHEEIPRLIALLQSTRETFENLIHSGYFMSASGDHNTKTTQFGKNQQEVLAAVNEIKKYILELRSQLLTIHHDQSDATEPKSHLIKNDSEKQLKKIEHMYKSAIKENESLRQKLEEFRSSNSAASAVQNTEKYFPTDTSSDLHLKLFEKEKEIASLKFDLAQREKDLETELKESRDKLRALETEYRKTANLEDELKNTKLELSVLQKRKEEETESILKRVQDLQEALDKKTEECKHLEQYIQILRTSYFRVFDNS